MIGWQVSKDDHAASGFVFLGFWVEASFAFDHHAV
jgi:hypothetical protein